jgi:predicted TIM-barrel fold metal-dependent hydrolase
MDKFSISKAVVFGFPWQDQELFRENNDAVLEFASRKPERIIPFATLGLDNADAACVEVERSLKSGFRGIGELSMYENGWDKASIGTLNDCVRIASSYRVPVMLHVNEPVGHNYPGKVFVDFNELLATIGKFPDVDFILAHLGGGIFFYSLMPEIAAILKNTYVDTAATPYIYDSRIFDISVNLMWEDRVLFGSDYPLLGLERYLREFEKSSMTDAQKNKILGQNAMGLLKLTSGE